MCTGKFLNDFKTRYIKKNYSSTSINLLLIAYFTPQTNKQKQVNLWKKQLQNSNLSFRSCC